MSNEIMTSNYSDEAPPRRKRGRPKGAKNKPKADVLQAALPAALAAEPDDEKPPFQLDMVETFFSEVGGKTEVGMGFDGLVLNWRRYLDEKSVTDPRTGELLVEPRFCSFRPGQFEKAAAGGFIPVLVDKDKRLSPSGKTVVVGPAVKGAANMQLLVRPATVADARTENLRQLSLRHAKSKESEAREIAKDLGLKDNFIEQRTEQTVEQPRKEL